MVDYANVKTGDVILCSGNSPTGFLLRTAVSTVWNHSAIAIRFIETVNKNNPEEIEYKMSMTTEGKLYLYETNVDKRFDPLLKKYIRGTGFSQVAYVFAKYNIIAVRKLHDSFRTKKFKKLTWQFILANRGSKFPTSSITFLEVWLGISLGFEKQKNSMFCSELMANYYYYTIGQQYQDITNTPFNNALQSLLGSTCPNDTSMITPEHYTYNKSPYASIFQGKEEIIYKVDADLFYIIIQPFIIIVFILTLIFMMLPKK
jgi:hypothetical protein